MNKIFLYFINKWWILSLFSAIIFALFFLFDNIWLLLISLIVITVTLIFQFKKEHWKLVCLTGALLFIYLFLSTIWIISLLFPGPNKIHRQYSKRYEKRNEIQNIIGVEIPEFKIVDSHLVYFRDFDFEFEVIAEIEFKTGLTDNFFITLDSICELEVPQEPDINSSFFYYSIESIGHCWSKSGREYNYKRVTDFGGKFLHSSDAYFYLTIAKGSKSAEIKYGNY